MNSLPHPTGIAVFRWHIYTGTTQVQGQDGSKATCEHVNRGSSAPFQLSQLYTLLKSMVLACRMGMNEPQSSRVLLCGPALYKRRKSEPRETVLTWWELCTGSAGLLPSSMLTTARTQMQPKQNSSPSVTSLFLSPNPVKQEELIYLHITQRQTPKSKENAGPTGSLPRLSSSKRSALVLPVASWLAAAAFFGVAHVSCPQGCPTVGMGCRAILVPIQ